MCLLFIANYNPEGLFGRLILARARARFNNDRDAPVNERRRSPPLVTPRSPPSTVVVALTRSPLVRPLPSRANVDARMSALAPMPSCGPFTCPLSLPSSSKRQHMCTNIIGARTSTLDDPMSVRVARGCECRRQREGARTSSSSRERRRAHRLPLAPACSPPAIVVSQVLIHLD